MISTDKSDTIRREFPADAPLEVSVRIGHGLVAIHAEDDLRVATVELTPRTGDATQVTVQRSGRTLSVHGPRQGGVFELFSERRRELSVDVVLRVPTGSSVHIATFTADVRITGRCGNADLATGTARVDVEHVDGDLRLRSGTATTSVGDVRGSVTLRSGSGDVSLGTVHGGMESSSGSGSLTTTAVHGDVRARAGAGPIHLGAVYSDVDLASGSGAMSLGVPAGVTAFIDAHTGHGSVRSDFPVDDRPTDGARTIRIRARTGTGEIYVHRTA